MSAKYNYYLFCNFVINVLFSRKTNKTCILRTRILLMRKNAKHTTAIYIKKVKLEIYRTSHYRVMSTVKD